MKWGPWVYEVINPSLDPTVCSPNLSKTFHICALGNGTAVSLIRNDSFFLSFFIYLFIYSIFVYEFGAKSSSRKTCFALTLPKRLKGSEQGGNWRENNS
jgi:hypothetical protein